VQYRFDDAGLGAPKPPPGDHRHGGVRDHCEHVVSDTSLNRVEVNLTCSGAEHWLRYGHIGCLNMAEGRQA
jgi:hypothetical protein